MTNKKKKGKQGIIRLLEIAGEGKTAFQFDEKKRRT